ncbi:MAG: heavy-metal-associated domain-containing protein [Planctomycetota bacterium]
MSIRSFAPSLLVALAFVAATSVRADEPPKPRLEFLYFAVEGAGEAEVGAAVERAVAAVPGVRSFAWTRERAEAKVIRVVGEAPTPALIEAFRGAKAIAAVVPVTQPTLVFQTRLHCNGCVMNVKRALRKLAGVKEITVAKTMDSVTLVLAEKQTSLEQVRSTLVDAGYPAR